MKATELLAEVKASNELFALGWSQKTCPGCKGSGLSPHNGSEQGDVLFPCSSCGGDGIMWQKPMTLNPLT